MSDYREVQMSAKKNRSSCGDHFLDEEEHKAIEVHAYHLSEKAGHDVGWEYAYNDWLRHYADNWICERIFSSRFREKERDEIELHKYYLSMKSGYDVGWKAAFDDWMQNHSGRWRRNEMKKDSEMEIKEMMKHKWIESEKAGHDLGERAIFDWVSKYAGTWRKERKKKRDRN